MNAKLLSLLSGTLSVLILAACSGSSQGGTSDESRRGGFWVLILFLALAAFFWWWLRQSDGEATPSRLDKPPRKDEASTRSSHVSSVSAPPAKPLTSATTAPVQKAPSKVVEPEADKPAAEVGATTAAAQPPASATVSPIEQLPGKPTEGVSIAPATPAVVETKAAEPIAKAAEAATTQNVEAAPVAAVAPGGEVLIEDPVRAKRLADKKKKAQKKGAGGEDDLTVVEGIGPKIGSVLHGEGIKTYAQLADTAVDTLRGILARNNLQYHDPGTWPEQSALAAVDKWEELEELQRTLSGGKRK